MPTFNDALNYQLSMYGNKMKCYEILNFVTNRGEREYRNNSDS